MAKFKEFPDIEIPSWLGPEWQDNSWHNDACGKMERKDFGGIEYPKLELFVNHDLIMDRDVGFKYYLSVLLDECHEAGNAILLLTCEESDTIQAGITTAVAILKACRIGGVREVTP